MDFRTFLRDRLVLLDGGTGTLLQERGLPLGELPERWGLAHPEILQEIHRAYFDAGSNVVSASTFGANRLKYGDQELAEIVRSAVENVRIAAASSTGEQEKFVALDIGPTGRLLKPYGDLDFEEAVGIFAQVVRLGAEAGADLVYIETMNDSYETKAALLAAKETCDLPVLVSCAYGEDGKLMTGASPSAMAAMLEGLGAEAVGANCSLGPRQLRPIIEELLAVCSVPVLVKANAGLPLTDGQRTWYDVTPEEFAQETAAMAEQGVRVMGGCCGTTPDYIRLLRGQTAGKSPKPLTEKHRTVISSYTHAVEFSVPRLIGERINPTGKKRFQQALREDDVDYILREGVAQQEQGAQILDVNVGLPDIDERELLPRYLQAIQAVVDLPLQIDTSDPIAMERALRVYNGKPLVNSVNGKRESMEAVFPLVKKYGGAVVALTLDEGGIPSTAAGRVAIARRIIDTAASYGIRREDLFIDTLAMAVSADSTAALTSLEALRTVRRELGVHTILGVSNVSFGLPAREAVNAAFFACALENGLSAAIINPHSIDMRKTYHAFRTLHNMDERCGEYIRFASEVLPTVQTVPAAPQGGTMEAAEGSRLQRAICKGLERESAALCAGLLETMAPLDIVNREIVPALDLVGKAYEEKRAYLPQLLMSAEAAKAAFERVKGAMTDQDGGAAKKGPFVLATVKGDIHDIGKNIVKVLLENYGFQVIDLGKDVAPEAVLEAVVQYHAPLAGLSALMTTTVPSMEETIRLLKEQASWCKTVVGGAVLTAEYARRIGADAYAKDGMETIRYAESVCGERM